MNNKDHQKAYRQSQKQKGLVELRGVWIKPELRDKAREILKNQLNALDGAFRGGEKGIKIDGPVCHTRISHNWIQNIQNYCFKK